MPDIGEIVKGTKVGFKRPHKVSWAACIDCGKERWVACSKDGKPYHPRCLPCSTKGELNGGYKGGNPVLTREGYLKIKLPPDDFFYPMAAKGGYVMEHRLVVAQALKRCLLPWELVHHKGTKYPSGSIENKSDNRYPENLELLPTSKQHLPSMRWQRELNKRDRRIEQLEKRVTLLEAENIVLESISGQMSPPKTKHIYPKD